MEFPYGPLKGLTGTKAKRVRGMGGERLGKKDFCAEARRRKVWEVKARWLQWPEREVTTEHIEYMEQHNREQKHT